MVASQVVATVSSRGHCMYRKQNAKPDTLLTKLFTKQLATQSYLELEIFKGKLPLNARTAVGEISSNASLMWPLLRTVKSYVQHVAARPVAFTRPEHPAGSPAGSSRLPAVPFNPVALHILALSRHAARIIQNPEAPAIIHKQVKLVLGFGSSPMPPVNTD